MDSLYYPIIIIGAGSSGLLIANGLAQSRKRVLLIDKGTYGENETNASCIPRKALIDVSSVAYNFQYAKNYGLQYELKNFDANDSLAYIQNIISSFQKNSSQKHLNSLNIDTLHGEAHFISPHILDVTQNNQETIRVRGKNIVIATGAIPSTPSIEGLENISYLTHKTIFKQNEIPESLAILGGDSIGCEIAQAFQRLGSKTLLVEPKESLLSQEEPEAQKIISSCFEEENIHVYSQHDICKIQAKDNKIILSLSNKSTKKILPRIVSHLFIATEKKPNLDALNLNTAHVDYTCKGIHTDIYGRTSQKHIWAVGSCTGSEQFTHVAEHKAHTILLNLLLPRFLIKRLDCKQAIPRITFTSPELASIGLTEKAAIEKYGKNQLAIYLTPFRGLDRSMITDHSEGLVKIITKKWRSKILGATIVAPNASEMITQIGTAMHGNIPLRKLATLIHPYPSYSLAIRKTAEQWLSQTILPRVNKWLS